MIKALIVFIDVFQPIFVMLKHNFIIFQFQQLLGTRMLFWVILTKEDSTINVEKRGGILQDTAQTMKTSSPIFRLKTSLICSLVEATRQVSVSGFHAKFVRYSIFIELLVMICLFIATYATLI